jgi:hypothetical protein
MRNLSGPRVKSCTLFAILLVCSLLLQAAAPSGWYVAGSNPADYEAGVDVQTAYNNHPSAYLRAKKPAVQGFGTLMQDFRAEKYAGKRVRLSAFTKAEGVQEWAGLWMRVDKGSTMAAFDNMQDRPIKGTTGWRNDQVVLDVPQDASGIFFGILLTGPGAVWLNSVKFEVVGTNVPTTGKDMSPPHRDAPANLNFED